MLCYSNLSNLLLLLGVVGQTSETKLMQRTNWALHWATKEQLISKSIFLSGNARMFFCFHNLFVRCVGELCETFRPAPFAQLFYQKWRLRARCRLLGEAVESHGMSDASLYQSRTRYFLSLSLWQQYSPMMNWTVRRQWNSETEEI